MPEHVVPPTPKTADACTMHPMLDASPAGIRVN
jgi:hypothetical protein